ncbi:MAG: phosphoribosylamine--glycine ligase [Thermoplasmata archaeon]|nr:phosphoribosylamine--glycine ligase [Thermoplasmata archaeon]
MRVLVVGGGAREHVAAWALARSGSKIYTVMKNNNPGLRRLSEEVLIHPETDVETVASWAEGRVEMAFIGPEAPLEKGLVDILEERGIPTVGPSREAARLETSKSFMRDLMRRHNLPGQVAYRYCENMDDLRTAVGEMGTEVVVKPVGLTGGKGARVYGEHLHGEEDIYRYGEEIFGGYGGGRLVVEEKLTGEEFTLQAFTDGRRLLPTPLVQDHKRAYEGDEGPNTGGMGSYSMADHLLPFVTQEEREQALSIMQGVIDAMREEGTPYKGILYGQFMLTRDGPKVVEFNARFGDPEAMNVLSILDDPLEEIFRGLVSGDLPTKASFRHLATVCRYVVPVGYGSSPKKGVRLEVDEKRIRESGALLFYASVDERDGAVYTTTSRSLAVVGASPEMKGAVESCERALEAVRGEYYVRHDIGTPEAIERKKRHMEQVRSGGQ